LGKEFNVLIEMSENYSKLLKMIYEERREILTHIESYLKEIKNAVLEKDPQAKILLYGSFVRGNFRPDSDIDILIISDNYGDDPYKYAEMVGHIRSKIKNYSLFEFHIVKKKTYLDWYSKFIDVYKEL
jgi:predicted nucleotidyltransferase